MSGPRRTVAGPPPSEPVGKKKGRDARKVGRREAGRFPVRGRAALIPSATWQPALSPGKEAMRAHGFASPPRGGFAISRMKRLSCGSVPPRHPRSFAAGIRRTVRAKTLGRGLGRVKFPCRFLEFFRQSHRPAASSDRRRRRHQRACSRVARSRPSISLWSAAIHCCFRRTESGDESPHSKAAGRPRSHEE